MKIHTFFKKGTWGLMLTAVLATGCQDVLEQEFRSDLGPEFFATAGGLEGGVTASYSIARFFWGSEGYTYTENAGTDESILGASDGNRTFFEYNNILPSVGEVASIWNNSYQAINNLNGVLKFGPSAAIDPARRTALLAEAKFLRAFYYFQLVRNFGDVPLSLSFIDVPTTSATRAPQAEVYAAMIKDLTEAVQELPATSNQSKGRATKPAALHLLAKVYLTRGWSAAAQPSDFATAAATARQLIDNQATYGLGLEQDFANVFREGNEYGRESIFVIDRNTDPSYAESQFNNSPQIANGNKENRLNFYWVSLYTNALNVNFGISGAPANSIAVMDRDTRNGRPFRRFRPTNYTLNTAFGERNNDSRYFKTFQSAWIFNRTTPVTTSRGSLVAGRDTAIWMPGVEVTEAQRRAFKGVILAPSQYTADLHPTMTKHAAVNRLTVNESSYRPIILFRLADTYLLAAEAYIKDNKPQEAAAMINAVRQRAAFKATNTAAQNAAAATAMTISPSQATIDFLLDERTRELYGENTRWHDLVRTQSLKRRLEQYNPTPGFRDFHLLRPIPQSQIDLTTTGPKFPQNPGYN
ncbi:RagB/SusD family nutrient uptake outer membrane protein [Rudanella paleaurantiibacter]|uniref:RagB/SusD family nutrient uptake outer membrane protein n=1 Tax=Rudanella paleaurantiibacter TaxID=2614655 RepID=A0A7J5TYD5_9BACT|nr:RagB/SusD family nutrient uptake outer membrane protein [Rudanella paleaurantiibacter]KAB7729947.1 RagB/SusD family nutrient uptake outer membrane protein [Rudanella paleaurantiibacter]